MLSLTFAKFRGGTALQEASIVNPRRIGDGWGWYVAAIVCFGFAIFITSASAGDPSALGAATAFWSVAGGFFLIGFAVRVAGKIEQRLMDIEQKLTEAGTNVKSLETV